MPFEPVPTTTAAGLWSSIPADWWIDVDGASEMLSAERVNAEIERLRFALQQIANLEPGYEYDWGRECIEVARGALDGTLTWRVNNS